MWTLIPDASERTIHKRLKHFDDLESKDLVDNDDWLLLFDPDVKNYEQIHTQRIVDEYFSFNSQTKKKDSRNIGIKEMNQIYILEKP